MMLEDILKNLKSLGNTKCYEINNEVYTYSQMYKYVCNMYYYLLENNKEKKNVIVYGHKDVYMIASFLACSFAGITYVPVDETMSTNRVNSIISQADPSIIIGDFKNDNVKNISKEKIYYILSNEPSKNIEKIYMQNEDTYYIIFTSGSTGRPKGVQVTYENIDSCVKWLKNITKLEKKIILNQALFSFDLSVADIYLSLSTGSMHYCLSKNVQNDFKALFEHLGESNANLMVITPSFAEMLLLDKSFNKELMKNLNQILFCGETLSSSTVKKLFDRFENLDIINAYGPTECTFAVTSVHLSKDMDLTNISVGIPKDDVEIYIVDEKLNILTDGEMGEILISGKSVAKGYLNDDISNSFCYFNGKKSYLTGDIGYIKEGKLYYKCRKDKQIKYRGYRIELTDIEKNILKFDFVEKVVVTTKKLSDGRISKILAFVKTKDGYNNTAEDIRDRLLSVLPEYMCPVVKMVNEFPLNQNGKCDEKRLVEEY